MPDLCSACTGKYACIPADGPMDARVYLVGERPGQWEEANARRGYSGYGSRRCFVGPTGAELNDNYLGMAGLDRDCVRAANTVRCGSDHNRKPTGKEITACSEQFLRQDLEAVNPAVVVLMGATACSLLPLSGGEEVDLDVEHGIAKWGKLWGWEGWVVPHYHPALGLHSTGYMTQLMEDWERLGKWLGDGKEKMWPIEHTQPPAVTDYRLISTWKDVPAYFDQYVSNTQRLAAVDTESHSSKPWSMQVSISPGTGLMIPIQYLGALEVAVSYLNEYGLVFHNAPADLGIAQQLGWRGTYRDTMQEAYHFGNQPQSLKALGYRLFGVKMQSWSDLVTPYSREKMLDYLIDAMVEASGRSKMVERYSEKTGKRLKDEEVKLPEGRALSALLRYVQSNPRYDPWKRLSGQPDADSGGAGNGEGDDLSRYEQLSRWLERNMGPWPEKGIAHVPLQEAVEYGCRDADITLRTAMEFDRMRPEVEKGWGVAEYDWDK